MSFHDIENPTGGMPMERVIDQPTPEQHLTYADTIQGGPLVSGLTFGYSFHLTPQSFNMTSLTIPDK